jgi:hypothetical protein
MRDIITWTPMKNSEREAARKFSTWALIDHGLGMGPHGRVLVAPLVDGWPRPDLDLRWVVPNPEK